MDVIAWSVQGDWHCLRGALLGCLSLLRRTPKVGVVEVEDAREMARLALENLHVQALAQRDRLVRPLSFFSPSFQKVTRVRATQLCVTFLKSKGQFHEILCWYIKYSVLFMYVF